MRTQQVCCFTGHRKIPAQKREILHSQIYNEIRNAIQDRFTVFFSGFAQGADLLFAEAIIDLKKQYPTILLKAAIPYAKRLESPDPQFQMLLAKCDGYKVICSQYQPNCFSLRNRYMVLQSQRVIAAYDGREKGGTFSTIQYAHRLQRDIRMIQM